MHYSPATKINVPMRCWSIILHRKLITLHVNHYFKFHWRLAPPYNLLADSPCRIVQLTLTQKRKCEEKWRSLEMRLACPSIHKIIWISNQKKNKQTNKQKNTHPTTLFSGPHCSLHILLLLVLVKPYWQSLLLKHFSVSCFLEQMCCNKVATDDNRLWEISILHYPVTHLLP